MHRKSVAIPAFLLVFSSALAAQVRVTKPNDFTLELGGKCGFYCLGYQRTLSPAFGLDAGVSLLGGGSSDDSATAFFLTGGARLYLLKPALSPEEGRDALSLGGHRLGLGGDQRFRCQRLGRLFLYFARLRVPLARGVPVPGRGVHPAHRGHLLDLAGETVGDRLLTGSSPFPHGELRARARLTPRPKTRNIGGISFRRSAPWNGPWPSSSPTP